MQIELIDTGWDQVLAEAAKSRQRTLRVICSFIKYRASLRLFDGNHDQKIQVITRFNLRDFYSGVSDIDALRQLLKRGAEIRGIRGLHTKMYLFGQSRTIVTSANLTEAALSRNHEFGFVSSDVKVAKHCHDYFDALWSVAGTSLTAERLAVWEKRLEPLLAAGSPPSREAGLPDEGADAAVLHLSITLPPLVSEIEQSFVKFLGEGDNRESTALPVIEEVRRSGCHWACAYPNGKRPRSVRNGAVIFMGRLTDDYDTIVFGRAIALAHVPGRDDASAEDIEERDWKARWGHYIRVYHGEFLAGTLANGIRLSDLMNDLGPNAFAATKRNLGIPDANTNPRRAYRQQAAVELSSEGFEWLNTRLEQTFRTFGKLTPSEMATLDWPSTTVAHVQAYEQWSQTAEARKGNTAQEYTTFLKRCALHYGEVIDENTVPDVNSADLMIGRVSKLVGERGRWTKGTFNERDVTQNLTPALRAYGRFVKATF